MRNHPPCGTCGAPGAWKQARRVREAARGNGPVDETGTAPRTDFTVDLLDGTQACVLAVIEHASRRIRILGITLHPTGDWTTQQARNLVMDLGEQAHRARFMIRDRGSNFTAAFDAVLADAGIRTVLCNIQTPRMNAIAERWIGGMPPRTPGPHPRLEPDPSATDPAPVRDPPQISTARTAPCTAPRR